MRNKILFGLLAIVAALSLYSFTDEKNTFAATVPYIPAALTGTITNTEIDTLTLATMVNPYRLTVYKKNTNTSGTTNVMTILDASTARSGTTNWVTIDTLDGTSTTASIHDLGAAVFLRYRFRLKGTGTQVSTYRLEVAAKVGF